MAEWLFSCVFRVYQRIMEVLGRNNRTPVEHNEEGMIWRINNNNIAGRIFNKLSSGKICLRRLLYYYITIFGAFYLSH